MFKLAILLFIVICVWSYVLARDYPPVPAETVSREIAVSPTPLPVVTHKFEEAPITKILSNNYHIYQTFNNCGPASLSMALSYFGIPVSQQELGNDLRPYQVPNGDNDDKSVTLTEMAQKAEEYGFTTYHRPNGNIEIIKWFIMYDLPVIARTWTKPGEDIGHYRVVKGYDSERGVLIQDDSLQGKNLEFSFDDFDVIWKKYNYEYLVLVPESKTDIAQNILGEDIDIKKAWEKAAKRARSELENDPNSIYSRFNLSVALYNIDEYQQAVSEFEKVENSLPFRTLWYQIEPIKAYYALENYQKVFEITDKILNNYNRAFSELYILRGKIYQKQGNIEASKSEFEKAVFYNQNLMEAQQLLNSL